MEKPVDYCQIEDGKTVVYCKGCGKKIRVLKEVADDENYCSAECFASHMVDRLRNGGAI